VFDNAIDTNSTVTAEFSTKWIKFMDAEGIPWIRNTQENADRVDHKHFGQTGSGDWSPLAQTRIQLPAVGVEVAARTSFEGYQLGGGQYVRKEVLFHVMAGNSQTAKDLADKIAKQNEKSILLFKTDLIADNNAYPLDYRGSPISGALTYPDLVVPSADGGFGWKKCRMYNSRVEDGQWITPDIFSTTVRMATEVILGDI